MARRGDLASPEAFTSFPGCRKASPACLGSLANPGGSDSRQDVFELSLHGDPILKCLQNHEG